MDAQLHLLPEPADGDAPAVTDWHLDESTRSVGRRGIAAARAALRSAAGNRHDDHDDRHASAA
jgi:hypothetical protein